MIVKLFEPIRIGELFLHNRIVMPPMTTNLGNEDGTVSDKLINYYRRRAKSGVALIIVEATSIDPLGRGFRGGLGIWEDKFIDGLKKLSDAIKSEGARAGIQIFHSGRQTRSKIIGKQPVAPSPVPWRPAGEVPRELTDEEIEGLIEKFGDGARRAKEAGFDVVEIHGAHGYLICQFLSPSSNKRKDRWGGRVEDRVRFAIECIKNVRKKTGNFPVIFRISADEFNEDGLKIEETVVIASILEENGIDAIHISGGCYESAWRIIPPMFFPEGCYVPYAERIKKVVKIPVIVAGRIKRPSFAEEILKQNRADMVSMGRALICDPDVINKFKDGRVNEIRFCTGCNHCGDSMQDEGIRCAINPEVGREGEIEIRKAPSPRKVLIVGGGPAGLSAARTLRLRGHEVILYEKENELGGNLKLASIPPWKNEMREIIGYYEKEMERLGVDVRKGCEVNPSKILEDNPDVVVIATGSVAVIPDIKGINGKNVYPVEDVLKGKVDAGSDVVIIGGGSVGCETAVLLAREGKRVTVLEAMEKWGRDISNVFKFGFIIPEFIKHGVRILTGVKIEEIKEGEVVLRRNGKMEAIKMDSVIIAAGYQPNRGLYDELKVLHEEVHFIGDCREVGRVHNAIQDGFEVGNRWLCESTT